MATYRQIHTQIWGDPDFEQLTPLSKLLFIYLFSNRHRNESALYPITYKKISSETDLTIEQVKKYLEELENRKMVFYDNQNMVVWVKNAVKYQSISPKGVIAINKDLKSNCSPLVDKFKDYYKEILKEGVSKGLARGIEGVSIPSNTNTNTSTSTFTNTIINILYKDFQKEFGRLITPIEMERISAIETDWGYEIGKEALTRAICQGKRNLRYIEGILENWRGANCRTLQEVLEHEEQVTKHRDQKKNNDSSEVVKVNQVKQKQQEENYQAAARHIKFTLGDKLDKQSAERLAGEYGSDFINPVLTILFEGG